MKVKIGWTDSIYVVKTRALVGDCVVEAVIFDMDGVLIETESIYKETFKQILSQYNVAFSDDFFLQLTGTTLEKGGAKRIIERFTLSVSEEQLIEKIYEVFDQLSQQLQPREGVIEIIKILKKLEKKVAVATSTVRNVALARLQKSDLIDFFDAMIFGDEVSESKPDPEIYINVLRKLKVDGSQAVVFEDSVNGVKSAIGAGILNVFGVLHDRNDNKSLTKAGAICAEKPPEIFHIFQEKMLQL